MKKITALILAAALACSTVPAQKTTTATDSVRKTVSQVDKTVAADSAFVDGAETGSDYLADGQPTETPIVGVKDGKWAISYDGADYILSDLVCDAELAERINALENIDYETPILKDNMGLVTVIIGIIFGFPCLTIIVGLIVIFAFALKRNRGRNELINNAIDHNYQLPDAFYVGQKNTNGVAEPTRDSRKFYSATTFIAIGLSLIVFAMCVDGPFFILVGGIPFLIGVGQLIGYFCVPASPRYNQMPPYGGQQFRPPFPRHVHWDQAPGQYPANQQQPYAPAPSSPMPPAPGHMPQDCPPVGQEDRQTPPPYNPS